MNCALLEALGLGLLGASSLLLARPRRLLGEGALPPGRDPGRLRRRLLDRGGHDRPRPGSPGGARQPAVRALDADRRRRLPRRRSSRREPLRRGRCRRRDGNRRRIRSGRRSGVGHLRDPGRGGFSDQPQLPRGGVRLEHPRASPSADLAAAGWSAWRVGKLWYWVVLAHAVSRRVWATWRPPTPPMSRAAGPRRSAAGGLLAMLTNSLMPFAFERGGSLAGAATAVGFCMSLGSG